MERRKWLTWAVGQNIADKIYDNIERANTTGEQCCFLSGSFFWDGTKEGYEYWHDINSKIQMYLNEKIDPQLASFLKEKGLYDKFINEFNPGSKLELYDLGTSFSWSETKDGYLFWLEVCNHYHSRDNDILNLTKNQNNENQLQGEETPRRGGDESGRSGVCYKRDEPRFRLSYTIHRERVDFQKRETRDFKVHISPRHSVLL